MGNESSIFERHRQQQQARRRRRSRLFDNIDDANIFFDETYEDDLDDAKLTISLDMDRWGVQLQDVVNEIVGDEQYSRRRYDFGVSGGYAYDQSWGCHYCERVFDATFHHALNVASEDCLAMARAVPWDFFEVNQPFEEEIEGMKISGEGRHSRSQRFNATPLKETSLVERVMTQGKLIEDSVADASDIFIRYERRGEYNCHVDDDENGEDCCTSDWTETISPECHQYINRRLPGIKYPHPLYGYMTNSTRWDKVNDQTSEYDFLHNNYKIYGHAGGRRRAAAEDGELPIELPSFIANRPTFLGAGASEYLIYPLPAIDRHLISAIFSREMDNWIPRIHVNDEDHAEDDSEEDQAHQRTFSSERERDGRADIDDRNGINGFFSRLGLRRQDASQTRRRRRRYEKTYKPGNLIGHVELARIHPFDIPKHHVDRRVTEISEDGSPDTSGDEYQEAIYQRIITKAGSRVWSISFATPQPIMTTPSAKTTGQSLPPTISSVSELLSSYPMQLLIRVDPLQQYLLYEAFDFQPIARSTFAAMFAREYLFCKQQQAHANDTTDVDDGQHETTEAMGAAACITRDDLERIAKIIRKTEFGRFLHWREQYQCMQDFVRAVLDAVKKDDEEIDTVSEWSEKEIRDTCREIGMNKLFALVNWVRFKQSTCYRARFPVERICGARLLVYDCKRPNANLSPPCSYYEIDAPEIFSRAERHTMEYADDALEPLGVLVIEVDQPGALLNQYRGQNVAGNGHPVTFTQVKLFPGKNEYKETGMRSPSRDWTPNSSFSMSTRHYIVGDASELKELCRMLCDICPRFRRFFDASIKLDEDDLKFKVGSIDVNISKKVNTLYENSYGDLLPGRAPPMQSLVSKAATLLFPYPRVGGMKVDQLKEEGCKRSNHLHQFSDAAEVHSFLRQCGVHNPELVNPCLKAGMLNGNVEVSRCLVEDKNISSDFLNVILIRDAECFRCQSTGVCCTVVHALVQSCLGEPNENDNSGAARCAFCLSEHFLSNLCGEQHGENKSGAAKRAFLVDGPNHNHCIQCTGFGCCVEDANLVHCKTCGKHYIYSTSCDCQLKWESNLREAPSWSTSFWGMATTTLQRDIDLKTGSRSQIQRFYHPWQGRLKFGVNELAELQQLKKQQLITMARILKRLLFLETSVGVPGKSNDHLHENHKICSFVDIHSPFSEKSFSETHGLEVGFSRKVADDFNAIVNKLSMYEQALTSLIEDAKMEHVTSDAGEWQILNVKPM